jgi:hypothetical protein
MTIFGDFPAKNAVYIWFWPTLHIRLVLANPIHVSMYEQDKKQPFCSFNTKLVLYARLASFSMHTLKLYAPIYIHIYT